MNPYEILGVPPHATQEEIKSAYRKLVKQFHPDVNKDHREEMIRHLNEAYDILSDPARKAAYDRGSSVFAYEYVEDPHEVYRREYIARKKEKDRKKREEENRRLVIFEARMKVWHRVIWIMTFPILLFALLVVVDYYLPQTEYREVAGLGWQRRIGERHYGRWHSNGRLVSYMQTEHFIIAVPDEVHVDYDYYATDKKTLTIAASPIFKIPSTVALDRNGSYYTFDVERTIFSNEFEVHYLLFVSSFFMVFRKDYSHLNFCLGFIPPFLLMFVLMIMF